MEEHNIYYDVYCAIEGLEYDIQYAIYTMLKKESILSAKEVRFEPVPARQNSEILMMKILDSLVYLKEDKITKLYYFIKEFYYEDNNEPTMIKFHRKMSPFGDVKELSTVVVSSDIMNAYVTGAADKDEVLRYLFNLFKIKALNAVVTTECYGAVYNTIIKTYECRIAITIISELSKMITVCPINLST